eukprot:scaffold239319_cov15-Tisochrysis_lutea.AAC.2
MKHMLCHYANLDRALGAAALPIYTWLHAAIPTTRSDLCLLDPSPPIYCMHLDAPLCRARD